MNNIIKSAKSINEQIAILEGRGFVIEDKNKAREYLLDIGYYRLGFFSFPFETKFPNLDKRDHIVQAGTKIEDVVDLYYFDCDLRHLIMRYLERIEVNVRTYISYVCSIENKNNPHWFADKGVMKNSFVKDFDISVYNKMKKNPVIMRHHKRYINDKYAPAWKTLEFVTLGGMLTLYDNIRDGQLKLKIARKYGCNTIGVFRRYLEIVRIIRNSCAHGSCIYNTVLPKRIGRGPAYKIYNEPGNDSNIKGAISIILHIVGCISQNRKTDLESDIQRLLSRPRSEAANRVIDLCTNYKICK